MVFRLCALASFRLSLRLDGSGRMRSVYHYCALLLTRVWDEYVERTRTYLYALASSAADWSSDS